MNAKYANSNIPIINYLAFRGYKPAKICWAEYYYISPFRPKEKTPSFCVNTVKRYRYDYGEKTGSNLVNLVLALEHVNVSQALEILSSVPSSGQTTIGFSKNKINPDAPKTKILKVHAIENIALKNYLKERRIPLHIGNLYFKEVHYSYSAIPNKSFFALGFPCGNGFATSNSQKKRFVWTKKDICFIPWKRTLAGKVCESVVVFEAGFDFVSLPVLLNTDCLEEDSIVLHGLAMDKVAKKFIKTKFYKKIFLFLDNDESGKQATKDFRVIKEKNNLWEDILKEILPKENYEIIDLSYKYEGFKDLNDYLKAK